MRRAAGIGVVLLIAMQAAGCLSHTDVGIRSEAKRVQIDNIRSVSVMPFTNHSEDADVGDAMRDALVAALRRRQPFYVRSVSADALPETPEAFRTERLSLEDVSRLRKLLGTDGMLLGWVDRYETYPHAMISLYVELMDLNTGEVAWHADGIWSAHDQVTARNMQYFYKNELHDDNVPHGWQIVRIEPRLFQEFVAYEVVSTLATPSAGE